MIKMSVEIRVKAEVDSDAEPEEYILPHEVPTAACDTTQTLHEIKDEHAESTVSNFIKNKLSGGQYRVGISALGRFVG